MKIRSGFVANSSSSSFIVGVKKLDENEEVKPSWLKLFYDKIIHKLFNSNKKITNVDEYLNDQYGYNTIEEAIADDDFVSKRNTLNDFFNEGIDIYAVEVDYDNQMMHDFLSNLPKKKNDNESIFLIDESN